MVKVSLMVNVCFWAINTIKANAAGLTWVNNVKAEPHKELIKPKSVQSTESHSVKAECSTELPKNQSSMLPPNFFDNNDTKMLKTGKDSLKSVETDLYKKTGLSVLPEESSNMRWVQGIRKVDSKRTCRRWMTVLRKRRLMLLK
ncbi:uncharacterized protein LOC112040597 [Quercus suber]|uniref:uncharacterized protein LOC112040597 n=1 Tax=Quercus suber TaxID=58331 RepID=UPI0032DFCF59